MSNTAARRQIVEFRIYLVLALLFVLVLSIYNYMKYEMDEFLVGTDSRNVTDVTMNQYNQTRARIVLGKYYGGDVEFLGYKYGPSGSIVISIKDKTSNINRDVYMLSDGLHLIDGPLYSPFMTPSQISDNHSKVAHSIAKLNKTRNIARKELTSKIKESISQPNNIKKDVSEAIKHRIKQENEAKKDHNSTITETIDTTSNQVNPALKTAKLPSNNNIVNKNEVMQLARDSGWVQNGNSNKVLYKYYDFRCSACLKSNNVLNKYISSGKVTVRYIPVGLLGEESLKIASLVLSQSSNSKKLSTMQKFISNDLSVKDDIGVLTKERFSMGLSDARNNFKGLLSTGRPVTPTMVYMTEAGPMITIPNSEDTIKRIIEQIKPNSEELPHI